MLQCLEDLDRNLQKLNSRLFVIRGQPADALPKLFKVSFIHIKKNQNKLNLKIFLGMGYHQFDIRTRSGAIWQSSRSEYYRNVP